MALERSELEAGLERYHADCFGWALACCAHDRTEAEDVLHSSYLKVLDGRAIFGSRAAFRTWLFGVIRRTAAEHRRRMRWGRLVSLESWRGREKRPDPAPAPDAELVGSETTARLLRAMAGLPRRQRELMHLVFYQDMTIQEAADVIGIAVGTARTHYDRAKKRLRELLDREGER